MTLSQILLPINTLQVEFEKYLNNLLDSNIQLLRDVFNYISDNKGKRLRPNLMLLTASALGGINEQIYDNAAMVELLHTSTLIHDDIVDESLERRGQPSINARWNNKIAVLSGDFIISHVLRFALKNNDFKFLDICFKTIEIMTEGELLAIQQSDKVEFDEEIYYKIIFAKTASLISSCCYISAYTATNGKSIYIENLKKYGEYVGMAFQIRDDIFDYISTSNTIGKPVGNDIKERKLTLPLIYALSKASDSKREEILSKIRAKKISAETINEIIDFTVKSGGIDYAMKEAEKFVDKAVECIKPIPESEAKNSLIAFAHYVIERNK